MSRIRSTNTVPELLLRRALWQRGLRGYRLHPRGLPGKPDIAWRRLKVAVFVDGAFWHGHPSAFRSGKSGAYWDRKIARNMARDAAANAALAELGWQVVRLWDFEIRKDLEAAVERVAVTLRGQEGGLTLRPCDSVPTGWEDPQPMPRH
jgi:DNA mismatch endonuclease (patch repair protein)